MKRKLLILALAVLAFAVFSDTPAFATGQIDCDNNFHAAVFNQCATGNNTAKIDRTAGVKYQAPYLIRFTENFYFGTETSKDLYGWGDTSDWFDFDSGWTHYAAFTYTGTLLDLRRDK